MIYRMRLTDGSLTIDFNPSEGYTIPQHYGEFKGRSLNGNLYIYQNYANYKWEIPISVMSASNASLVNSWKYQDTELAFFPDYTENPGVVFVVKLVNDTLPLDEMIGAYWNRTYKGKLILEVF